ncbi:enoyl-CoA hydratase domain-containing protein 3, mitochondrial [Echeneis naucrates]|uniref:Enoyl-CoA hydratase domain-containing protein 3, mitochondrial n=1 Tax=Echeneis naucrates TaxID=173247 RepID=A0A665UVL2_ECHNA|nr:enoyl-CoA hydratase domain-containing protein 3, mitochondrial [Echeneis naucrates]
MSKGAKRRNMFRPFLSGAAGVLKLSRAWTLQTRTGTLQTWTRTLQTRTGTLQAWTRTLQTRTGTLQTWTRQTWTRTLQTRTGTLQTRTGILQTWTRTLQTRTGTLQTWTRTLQTRTGTLQTCTRSYCGTEPEPLTVRKQQEGIRRIILNNPKKRNALSLSMLESLRENILTDVDREDLRVIIISAKGPVFSSGHDLKELTSAQGRHYHTKVFDTCAQVMTLIQDIPVPVVAMVNGVATAAGCQLVASCDIAVVTEKSTFATPGVNVGLFCSTPAVAIGRAVPRKVAMEMLFTGTPISAHDALLHGLVSKVVPEERLEEETMAIAQRVCQASRPVVALGKATFQRQMAQGRDAAYATASKVMVDNLALTDGQEGIRAFIEKRKPVWSNKAEKAHD